MLEKKCGGRNSGMMSEGFPLVWLVVIIDLLVTRGSSPRVRVENKRV